MASCLFHMQVCIYTCLYTRLYICTHVCMRENVHLYICMHICINVYVYTCVHMYVCICMLHACMYGIYNMWLSLQKGSYTCNYKYLEIQF